MNSEETKVNTTLKNRIITLVALVIASIGASVWVIEKMFSDYTPTEIVQDTERQTEYDSFEGVIKFIPEGMRPEPDIEYELVDADRNHIIYLKCKDNKLEVAENLEVKVRGVEGKTSEGQPTLVVKEVAIVIK